MSYADSARRVTGSARDPRRRSAPLESIELVLLLLFCFSISSAAEQKGLDLFENRVRPLLIEHCYECHSGKAEKLKGGLRLDSKQHLLQGGDSGRVIIPGDPERSLLIRAVRHLEKDFEMPPAKDGGKKLSEAAITDLIQWVKMGAPYPDAGGEKSEKEKPHWSFQPVGNPPVPPVRNQGWSRNSIDPFILAKLEAHGLEPAPTSDKRALMRRATFDLTGLPPTPQEMEAFLADDSSTAFARVVERLLGSPHYGERWGRHWLDVVRYADTAGDTADYPIPSAWRYRNYVIDAFNADKSYREFIREQIAGDILATEGPAERYAERVTATGYLALSRRFGFDSENYHHLTIQDTIDTMGQTVLGLSLGCARCHNHKFDPVTSTEYYALYGIFESTRYAFPGSEQKNRYRALVPLQPAAEATAQLRAFQTRFAELDLTPPAILRSLNDLDGDFEMQHIASGGSKGVLVPPWFYRGPLSVTTGSQSPFKNVYPFGIVGAVVAKGTHDYRVWQTFHPPRRREKIPQLHVNLDFRVATNLPSAEGRHRFWIGSRSAPALEVFLSANALQLGSNGPIVHLHPAAWHNLQLSLDLHAGSASGSLGRVGQLESFPNITLAAGWNGLIDFVAMEADGSGHDLAGIEIDNVGIQETPLASLTDIRVPSTAAAKTKANLKSLRQQLESLVGIDGDFEAQASNAAPVKPWHPGPNSAVKVLARAQSPFRNLYPAGELGIHLPRTDSYNGFGQTLTNRWSAEDTERLYVSFDFRAAPEHASDPGVWRFYLGQATRSSAVELAFNGRQLFCLDDQERVLVAPLKAGEWYQVQLELDLAGKRFEGSVATLTDKTAFAGRFAAGWNGHIDYTYVDSGGHISGRKPALDLDNFVVREIPLRPLDAASPDIARKESGSPRPKIDELRREVETLNAALEKPRKELIRLLAEGPIEMAYGMAEGTPANARLQMRGDPDKLGQEVPRGFVRVLGGADLPSGVKGSGRLELAEWLTRADNPLTTRVLVNRLWQYHFGQGLVKTPNDFGTRGQPPTHPELLDHLATQFLQTGWSIKSMHRLIMLSATYQQSSSSIPPSAGSSGAANPSGVESISTPGDFFSPFVRRRLSAEEIRDSIIFVSGQLDERPGAEHPFPAPTTWGYSQHGPFNAVYEHNRRSVYLMTQRLKRHPFLALFDGADPNSSTAERRTTTVPTQALFFLNDPFVHRQAGKLAERLQAAAATEEARIESAYRLAFGRSATPGEQDEAKQFLAVYRGELSHEKPDQAEDDALAAFARVLYGSNEFLSVE